MKIYIKDVRLEGIRVEYQIPSEAIGLAPGEYLQFIKPVQVYAQVDLVNDTLLCKTTVKSRYKSSCCRTLVDVERDWSQEFLLDFEIKRSTEFIELDDDIRQEIILSLPVRVLCDEEMAKEKESEKEASLDESPSGPLSKQKTYRPFENLKFKEE
ncbi:MAG TPA: hypothetical protein VI749_01665 [Candidatus Omnitrophota bacterium]|nr:hypothetical protein [Candidatus Omnitrophota bacterium]